MAEKDAVILIRTHWQAEDYDG